MAVWACPECKRTFGKANQGHMCAPGMTEKEYFATGPAFERPIYDEVKDFMLTLPDVRIEFVSVGVFFKRRSTFAELRPLTKWSRLTFNLPRAVQHPSVKATAYGSNKWWHQMKLLTPDDVTDDVRGWLAEAAEENK